MKAPVEIRKVNSWQHPGCQKEGLPSYTPSNGDRYNSHEGLEAEFGMDEIHFEGKGFDEIFDHAQILKYYRGEVPREVSHYDPFPEKSGLRC
ncbi:MAG: hypothetical protein AMJ94_08290 [Deltaproteobacteria bacterium SM23_61]|nr:MAG: hypothetical protein AMJ94_08290 [Deltaproteobacteria bacterium SM23_61]